nr:hypothetical protein [uncultured Cohaesibacter sp.]
MRKAIFSIYEQELTQWQNLSRYAGKGAGYSNLKMNFKILFLASTARKSTMAQPKALRPGRLLAA